ncbi:hypothetical protein OC846_001314 [Tilletia horrida]|uniref:Major facilitator superfamily (MFS) profile domain-containing protein n=1 Tax=Tilletia horrida TaxID=155126 RepID=A0AAN6GT76_9BASI|nr:hypothetical protein OC846_001314 [Tilletia horrida]
MSYPVSTGASVHSALPVVLQNNGQTASPTSDSEQNSEKAASLASVTHKESSREKGDLVEPEDDPAPYKFADFFRRRRSAKARYEPDAIATVRAAFDDDALEPQYRPPTVWENHAAYDPDFRWTYREQDEVTRILDKRVMVFAMLFFAVLNIDRNNLAAANSDNILKDLGLTTNDFNNATSLFRGMFLLAELPGQILSKRFGPDRFIPCQMAVWGILTIAQMGLSGKHSYYACRALLGLAQGSFIPDLLLYLSYFYTKKQLPIRLALFWVAMNGANGLAAVVSAGILEMRGVAGLAGWRWLFFWEGLLSIALAAVAFVVFVPSATSAKWLNDRQTKIVVNRVLRDDPGKHQMHNRAPLTVKHFIENVTNWRFYPFIVIGILFAIPQSPPQTYLTLSLRSFGFSRIKTQALSSVQYWVAIPLGIAIVALSDTVRERALVALIQDLWILPLIAAILGLGKRVTAWKYFGLATLIGGAPYAHPIQTAWVSASSGNVSERTIQASLYNMAVQAGSIIASQVYRADDKPLYHRGNSVLVAICAFNIVFYIATRFFYRAMNRSRDRKWNAMSSEEKARYLAENPPSNRRLDFRFEY